MNCWTVQYLLWANAAFALTALVQHNDFKSATHLPSQLSVWNMSKWKKGEITSANCYRAYFHFMCSLNQAREDSSMCMILPTCTAFIRCSHYLRIWAQHFSWITEHSTCVTPWTDAPCVKNNSRVLFHFIAWFFRCFVNFPHFTFCFWFIRTNWQHHIGFLHHFVSCARESNLQLALGQSSIAHLRASLHSW